MTIDSVGNIQMLEPWEVFIYGANEAGRHGRGAALTAFQRFGAVQGQAEFNGQSYGLSTLDGQLRPLHFARLRYHRDRLLRFCISRPDLNFYLTKVGTGLAGYPVWLMQGLFNQDLPVTVSLPANLFIPQDWAGPLWRDQYWPKETTG